MNEADIIATTYYHRARVLRPAFTDDGSVFNTYENKEVYKDLACAVSFSGGSTQGESDTVQAVNYVATLFARPEVDIQAGDIVEADVYGTGYSFIAGQGVIYPSHIEVPLIKEEEA